HEVVVLGLGSFPGNEPLGPAFPGSMIHAIQGRGRALELFIASGVLAGPYFLAGPVSVTEAVEGSAFDCMRLLFHGLLYSLLQLSEAAGGTFSQLARAGSLKSPWFAKKPNGLFGGALKHPMGPPRAL